MRLFLSLALSLAVAPAALAQDLVAKTDAKSPAEELKCFKLPDGFEAQLVASEPDIQKPMQMAFDAKGRMWVTTSHLYPFAVAEGKGTDKLFVLSDFGADGKAKKVQVFDDKLNIPIGVLPLADGKSVIVSECGKILKLTDTDGDMKADKREVLFSGFGFVDTHGMTNSFTLMPDGWVYACHGFRNDSTVKGTDGHEVKMNSGHTFRFKTDGSRIEIFTRGQVNPFGMCVDPWLNLYTADCHSKPMTQLVRGAYYQSFGKPHDGLGYAPHVINHLHGSTGLSGIVYYSGGRFPKEWQDVMFVGNCVTNRINCDKITWKGATPVGEALPDFMSSTDAWFRPVYLKMGPDGAMYVSDFYNKIIGHYEVDLKHPGRDHDHGRIWRIVYTGSKKGAPAVPPKELAAMMPIRALAEAKELTAAQRDQVADTLAGNVRVARVAVDVITARPDASFVTPLLKFIPTILAEDAYMKYAAKVALRNCLDAKGGLDALLAATGWNYTTEIIDVLSATKGDMAVILVAGNLKAVSPEKQLAVAELVGRKLPPEKWHPVASFVRSLPGRPKVPDADEHAMKVLLALFSGGQKAGWKTFKPDSGSDDIDDATLDALRGTNQKSQRLALQVIKAWAGQYGPKSLYRPDVVRNLLGQFVDKKLPTDLRMAGVEAMVAVDPMAAKPALREIVADVARPVAVRQQFAPALLVAPSTADCATAKDAFKSANYSFALTLAVGLAGDKFGADLLLAAVKAGEAPARLLQEKAVLDRLRATKVPDLDKKVAELTKGILPPDKRIEDLIKKRAVGFRTSKFDSAKGKAVFTKSCAICHQINNEGAKVGPQLDGVGIRGLERLLEDTLDPNRNLDGAFKSTTLILTDGRSPAGLVREDGNVYVLIDGEGKENRIPKADVDKVVPSNLSAMPANVDSTVSETDYYHLLAYLLQQTPK